MLEILYRLRVPLVLVALAFLTGATLLADRRQDPRGPDGEHWWSGALFEITVPLQKMVSMPLSWARERYSRYVDLVDLRAENELLRTRITSPQWMHLKRGSRSWMASMSAPVSSIEPSSTKITSKSATPVRHRCACGDHRC